MATQPTNDLADFNSFVTGLLAHGESICSPEEALKIWRSRSVALNDDRRTVDDVRAALADMEDGDHGRPVEDIDREIRAKYFFKSRT